MQWDVVYDAPRFGVRIVSSGWGCFDIYRVRENVVQGEGGFSLMLVEGCGGVIVDCFFKSK